MSWQARVLNPYLRLTEKTHLDRAKEPSDLRRSFERKARLLFHGPRGTNMTWCPCGSDEALHVTPTGADPEKVILYLHGGGYVFGSPDTHSAMLASLAKRAGGKAILPRYPLAPEHSAPAALDQAWACYQDCLSQGISPNRIVMGGDSAGGGLVLALLARLLSEGVETPAGVFAFSPLTDMTFSGASFQSNARADVVLPARRAAEMAGMYLAGRDPAAPDVSPLFADFTGAPDLWLTVGDTEILLDDTRRLAARLTAQNVPVQLHVERDLPHVWPIFHNTLPEARATLDTLAAWITRRWDAPSES